MLLGAFLFWTLQVISQTTFNVNDKIEAQDQGKWYKATVLKVEGGKYFIHWEGYSSSYDSWITPDKTRAVGSAPVTTTTTGTGSTTTNTALDPSKYLFGDALVKFKKDMLPFNEAVAIFCFYLKPRPWLDYITYANSSNIGTWLNKIKELEAFLQANYPSNCNSDPAIDGNRYQYDFKEQPSVYREVCEHKYEIAQMVLEYEAIDQSWNRAWLQQYDMMQVNFKEQQYIFNDYLKYLVLPKMYEQEKANRRARFEPLYQSAGVPYDDKRIFALQDSLILETQKFLDANIAAAPSDAWIGSYSWYPYDCATYVKMASDAMLRFEPNAKIIKVKFDATEPYKVYDENYAPPLLIGKRIDGVVACTLPYTNYVYMFSFTLEQEYQSGSYTKMHFAQGDQEVYFSGIASNQ